MKACIIIPARLASSRFPRKMLHEINGARLIYWTWRQAMRVGLPVFVASEDAEILAYVAQFGGRAIFAKAEHNGTERCAAALEALGGGFDIVVNWQGDSPLTNPEWCRHAIEMLRKDMALDLSTVGYPAKAHPGCVAIANSDIPNAVNFYRPEPQETKQILAHAGIYAIRGDSLRRYGTEALDFEIEHGLEQLRWTWYRFRIGIAKEPAPRYEMREVNSPEDVEPVAASLRLIHETL